MARLTYKRRKSLPDSDFALPDERRFPINDKAHARNALARLSQAKGLDSSEKSMVKRKANKKLYGTADAQKIKIVKKRRGARRK